MAVVLFVLLWVLVLGALLKVLSRPVKSPPES